MLNSLMVFLAFLGFLAFGYLSIVRLLTKQSFAKSSLKHYGQGLRSTNLLQNLGSSAFFLSLPATSLLLFWGWGPALLWLVIFHLFVESMCHLQYSAQQSDHTIADHLLRSKNPALATVEQGLIQAFFLLSMAVVTALLATLVDRQSGLLFAILFLLPARKLLRYPSSAFPLVLRVIGGFGLLALGLAFSDQLGFSIYGDWAPFGETLGWLRFNNPTVIAAVLVVAVFQLEKDAGFKNDLSTFAGLIIVLLLAAMVVKLVWLQPVLDAPLNSAQLSLDSLPSFASLSLFLFAGFAALLIRLLIDEENQDLAKGAAQFSRLQSGGFIHLIFMLVLGVSLAAALGIGSWKTHYIEWSNELNLLDHLNLAITSALHLVDTRGDSGSVVHTVLLAALCFTGFSFMLMCADQLSLEESERESMVSVIIESKILQAILIFVSSTYFISHGISLNMWFLIGILGWILVTHLMMGMTLEMTNPSARRTVFSAITLGLLAVGAFQTSMLGLGWALGSQWVYSAIALALLLIAAVLWTKAVIEMLSRLAESNAKPPF